MASLDTLDIAQDVLRVFGDDAQVQVTETDIIRWINDAQLQIARDTDCLVSTVNLPVVAGEPSIALPADFLKFRQVQLVGGNVLWRTSSANIDELIKTQQPFPTGVPQMYFFKPYSSGGAGASIWLWPAYEQAGNISLEYTHRPTEIAGLGDAMSIPIEMRGEVKSYCLAQAYKMDDNFTVSQITTKEFEQGVLNDRDDFKHNEVDSYPSIRSVGDDVW